MPEPITISAIVAAFGGVITTVASAGSFLASLLFLPFKIAGDNKTLATFLYWIVFFIDSFFISPLISIFTTPLFQFFGLEGVEIGFTSIFLIVINIVTVPLFGWYFAPFHLLMLASIILLAQLAAWCYGHYAAFVK